MKIYYLILTMLVFTTRNLICKKSMIKNRNKTQESKEASNSFFFVIEGIEGCGKTTLINNLKKIFIDEKIYFTKEPFATNLKDPIKFLLKKTTDENDFLTQYLAFATERSYHINKYILPQLKQGNSVISDRFIFSSLAYQGININSEIITKIYKLTNHNIKIDIIFYCRLPYEIALERVKQRDTNDFLDEHYIKQLQAIEAQYEKIFKNDSRVVYLDMTKPPEEISEYVASYIKEKVNK